MDSRFAIFFLITGLTDTYLNECPTDCRQKSDAPARVTVQYGDTYFQEDVIGTEVAAYYDLPFTYGAYQPTVGASLTSSNDLWVGAGGKWSTDRIDGGTFFVELSLMPGIYFYGDGPDIGFPLQFRGALGAGYTFENGSKLGVFFDHRSNANASEYNPGIETLSVRYAITLE